MIGWNWWGCVKSSGLDVGSSDDNVSRTCRPTMVTHGADILRLNYLVENAKDTLCRNVTIYGRCRFEDKGAAIVPCLSHPAMSFV